MGANRQTGCQVLSGARMVATRANSKKNMIPSNETTKQSTVEAIARGEASEKILSRTLNPAGRAREQHL